MSDAYRGNTQARRCCARRGAFPNRPADDEFVGHGRWESAGEAAKQAAKETERAAKGPSAWTQALTANTAAVQDSAKELNDFRGKVNQSAESLGKIGVALSAVSPELGGFVASAQQGIGAVSGLSGAMGTLGYPMPF